MKTDRDAADSKSVWISPASGRAFGVRQYLCLLGGREVHFAGEKLHPANGGTGSNFTTPVAWCSTPKVEAASRLRREVSIPCVDSSIDTPKSVPPRITRFPRNAGLTLIEIMLALTIVAIGLVTLLTAASRCIAVARSARIYEHARHMLGRVELENPIRRDEVEEGTEHGYFEGNSDYTWQRTIEQIGEEEDPLFLVKTRVNWSERGKESFEEVVTYMFIPEALDEE